MAAKRTRWITLFRQKVVGEKLKRGFILIKWQTHLKNVLFNEKTAVVDTLHQIRVFTTDDQYLRIFLKNVALKQGNTLF